MQKIDLANYDLSELKGLQHEVEKQIKNRQQQDVQKAREQIFAIAQEAGISVEELLGSAASKSRKNKGQKVEPQYRNPADSSQTWSGRGRQPRWIAEQVAIGKTLDDFRI
jgi:DNA-binding protein H-NS